MAKYSFYRPHERVTERNEMVSPVTGEVTNPPSMTKQEFIAECDINNIIKAYSVTGMLTHVNARAKMGVYEDLPDETDFQMSLEIIRQGETAFMTLPAKIRDRFHNEPAEFLAFLANPENLEEARTLGLANPAPPPPPAPPLPETVPEKPIKD